MDSSTVRSRKRRPSPTIDSDKNSDTDTLDDDLRGGDKKKSWQKGYTKQNHSEIEKRRRDKMNTYIVELSSMIPMCNAMSRKLDKLTVLRMAVQHMKTLKGAEETFTETRYKPSFLSDEDLKNLILEAAEGFLVVVGCDRGCILYVSDSIQNSLSQSPSDLVGHSFFDLVHPKDVAKVKEQLSYSDSIPREKGPDVKTGLALKTDTKQGPNRLCSGARRSFFCRMKCGSRGKRAKDAELDPTEPCIMNRRNKNKQAASADRKQYSVVHSTGYLKSWPPAGSTADDDDEEGTESRNLSCLVAVCRVQKIHDEDTDYTQPGVAREFISRHGLDGKFIFVDQRTTTIIGYLPQELLGMSAYEFFHQDDLGSIAITHKRSLEGETAVTDVYRFRAKAGHYIPMKTKTSSFRNPWTKELEFLLCVNSVITGFEYVPQQVEVSRPSQRQILPASALSAESGLAPTWDQSSTEVTLQKNINQLIDGMSKKEQQEEGFMRSAKKARPNYTDDDNSVMQDPRMARIGALVLEEIHNQKASSRGKQRSGSVGVQIPVGSSKGQVEQPSLSPGPSTSSMPTVNFEDLLGGDGGMRLSGSASAQGSPGVFGDVNESPKSSLQSYLLEQLIGMQNAIESMDSAQEQSEESMSVFMNMLEADAGLGGDFDDLPFPGS